MKFVIFCVILTLIKVFSCAERAVWVAGESGLHPSHPGKCWSAELNREFSVGEEYSDKTKCELIRCGQNYRFNRRLCSQRQPQPGCSRTKADNSKSYPDCCSRIECPPVKIDHKN